MSQIPITIHLKKVETHNYKAMAISIVSKYYKGKNCNFDELINIALSVIPRCEKGYNSKSIASFTTYVYNAMKYEIWAHLNKQKRMFVGEVSDRADERVSWDGLVDVLPELDLSFLTSQEQRIIKLRILSKPPMKLKEVAKLMSRSISTISVREKAALIKLAERLKYYVQPTQNT